MNPGGDQPVDDGAQAERDDAALLEAHVAGDPAAFGELFTRHRDRLWAVALRTTGNPDDAADALQDAMISAFRRAGSFRGDSAVTTWLHRVVVNACLDRLRRMKVRAADPLPDDLEDSGARGTVLAASGPGADPEGLVVSADRRRRVLAALDELPPDQKAALVLVDLEGYPVLEAGRILDVPPGTIKSRCARGRSRLAVLLADLHPDVDRDPDRDPGRDPGRDPDRGPQRGPQKVGRGPVGTPGAPDASHPGDPPRAGPHPDGTTLHRTSPERGGEQP